MAIRQASAANARTIRMNSPLRPNAPALRDTAAGNPTNAAPPGPEDSRTRVKGLFANLVRMVRSRAGAASRTMGLSVWPSFETRRFAALLRMRTSIRPDLQPHEDRQQDHDDHHRKDAERQRHGELGGQAVGLLLRARHPLVAHVIGIDAQRLGQGRAEFLGLL